MTRIVLKLGGRIATATAEQALALHAGGDDVVVVHGAGPQITTELELRGIPVSFVDGRRVTDASTLAVVRPSLLAVGAEICSILGAAAVQLAGDEIGMEAEQVVELGLVGRPLPCCPEAIEQALSNGRIPVVAPLAVGPLNVNADEAASALAVGLGAQRLIFVTDVPGVYVEGALARELGAVEASRMLDEGAFEGGIVPKLLAAVRAASVGVRTEIGETAVVA